MLLFKNTNGGKSKPRSTSRNVFYLLFFMQEISKDVCNDFRRNSDMHWRTLLFIKHFEYLPLTHDVTFVAQLSYDRIYMLEELFNTWEGIVLYVRIVISILRILPRIVHTLFDIYSN